MKNPKDRSEYLDIDSFDELRKKKKELSHEIQSTGTKVTSSTEHLFKEGAKVVAVGFVAFIVSRLLSAFMTGDSGKKEDHETVFAQTATSDQKQHTSRTTEDEATDQAAQNSHRSTVDSARIWLETIAGGIEAAKIILDQFSEIKENVQNKAEQRDTETEEVIEKDSL